jgi:hypothetical protein
VILSRARALISTLFKLSLTWVFLYTFQQIKVIQVQTLNERLWLEDLYSLFLISQGIDLAWQIISLLITGVDMTQSLQRFLHGGPQTMVLILVLYHFFTSFSVNSELPSPD